MIWYIVKWYECNDVMQCRIIVMHVCHTIHIHWYNQFGTHEGHICPCTYPGAWGPSQYNQCHMPWLMWLVPYFIWILHVTARVVCPLFLIIFTCYGSWWRNLRRLQKCSPSKKEFNGENSFENGVKINF